ncbi:Transposase, IS116/IS110/IS902, partial [mine drainage metagenome]
MGKSSRRVLEALDIPDPWKGNILASIRLIDDLNREIEICEKALKDLGADHQYVPRLMSIPGIGPILSYTIASEIGDIKRFATPKKLTGYSGLCPRVIQSGDKDWRGPLSKSGPRYLRWALIEAATHACHYSAYEPHYNATIARLGKRR